MKRFATAGPGPGHCRRPGAAVPDADRRDPGPAGPGAGHASGSESLAAEWGSTAWGWPGSSSWDRHSDRPAAAGRSRPVHRSPRGGGSQAVTRRRYCRLGNRAAGGLGPGAYPSPPPAGGPGPQVPTSYAASAARAASEPPSAGLSLSLGVWHTPYPSPRRVVCSLSTVTVLAPRAGPAPSSPHPCRTGISSGILTYTLYRDWYILRYTPLN